MPPRQPRKSFAPDASADAVDDHRARLERMRDQLTEQMAVAAPAYVAGIARQLQAVLGELASLPDTTPDDSPVARITARRLARAASDPSSVAVTMAPGRHRHGVVGGGE